MHTQQVDLPMAGRKNAFDAPAEAGLIVFETRLEAGELSAVLTAGHAGLRDAERFGQGSGLARQGRGTGFGLGTRAASDRA
jgi:hypothetical protein